MEDEGSYGNDDIRCFILSNLAMARMSKTYCVICQSAMQIYDRYPLIDGTFFLSPKQYSKACIPVSHPSPIVSRIGTSRTALGPQFCSLFERAQ